MRIAPRCLWRAAVIALLLTIPLLSSTPTDAQSSKLALAFYYAWFDQNSWGASQVPDTPTPTYVSRDRATMERHVAQAQGAGLDAFVQAWWGTGNQTDDNLRTLLEVAQKQNFRIAATVELSAPGMSGNRAAVTQNLRTLIEERAAHPAYLRWVGKPVIFFWRQQQFSVATWQQIRREVDPNRSTIWIAEGTDIGYQAEFDGHYLYSIAWDPTPADQLVKWGNRVRAVEPQWGDKLWVATVMPGYDDTKLPRADAFRRDRANGDYLRESFRGATESQADWIIVTSWNEFPEGTHIEPSALYGDFYLRLTGELVAAWKRNVPPPPPAGAAEWAIPGGRFFTQSAGGQGGFGVVDDAQARFWTEFQRLGGTQTVGYPISRRFVYDGFVTQAFQKLVLQWRPERGQAVPVNLLDELSRAGVDARLLAERQVPLPADGLDLPGASWAQIVAGRQALLSANPAIRARYFAVRDPLTTFGLPLSRVEDMGSHYAIRTQRAVFQQWKQAVPWAAAGEVTIANGGDIAREMGWFSAEVLVPEPTGR